MWKPQPPEGGLHARTGALTVGHVFRGQGANTDALSDTSNTVHVQKVTLTGCVHKKIDDQGFFDDTLEPKRYV